MRELEIWTIYDHPRDFPDHFVVRCWVARPMVVRAHTGEVWLRPTLDEAREVIYGNVPAPYRFPREPGDDPCIVESWI